MAETPRAGYRNCMEGGLSEAAVIAWTLGRHYQRGQRSYVAYAVELICIYQRRGENGSLFELDTPKRRFWCC
ncbi:hypothetical protein HOLleu_06241 [Holothuria leucospilota]|uniref:Uncharacterized protein n=1 Tax=Holothuria leucospilota TaxID=206669 RepID=A0A9Q1CMJ3_HOLLE|nr:hypothetical protein HOLleu_06241 [Holothuria leucospilota]